MTCWWLLVLLVSLGLCIAGITLSKWAASQWDREGLGVLGLEMAVVFGATAIFGSILTGVAEETYDKVVYNNIYSVRGTDNEVDGRFFLGSGHIDEDSYYVVFVEDDKGIGMRKFDTDFAYIVEVPDDHYYVRYTKEKWTLNPYYTIYVPEGTVIVEFKI